MGFGILKHLHRIKVRFDVQRAMMLYRFSGLESVERFLKQLNKHSIEVILRKFGAKIGDNCDIEYGLTLHNFEKDLSNLQLGKLCHIGKDVLLDLHAPIIIREKSTISMRTIILTHMDTGYAGPFERRYSKHTKSVEIGAGAYIGAGTIILPGIKIGDCSIVGAGALVNRDVTTRTAVAGVPAREYRRFKKMENDSV